jgi:hypothetical protein
MPLSDREQQILSEIEAQLRQDDPKLARAVGTTTVSSRARRRIKLSAIAFVLGFVLLLSYIPTQNLLLGVLAFVVMLGSVVVGGDQLKRLGSDQSPGDLGGQVRGGFNRYLGDKRGRNGETQH